MVTRKTPLKPAPAKTAAGQPAPAKTAIAKAAAAKATKLVKADKPPKPPKLTLVRDSFTMPEPDFALIALLKARAMGAQRAAKKSELLRAGLQALAALEGKALVAALDGLAPVKTGRPKKGH